MQFINGKVTQGKKHGRLIGFPTANIIVEDLKIQYGVWATKTLYLGRWLDSISYFTQREGLELFETYIFDFEKQIYNEHIEVKLIQFLRSPVHFETEEKLVTQLKSDCILTKEILSKLPESKK